MAKITADTETNTIKLEANPDKDLPSFVRSTPVIYEGELTSINLEEAIGWLEIEGMREKEELAELAEELEEGMNSES
jgi:hypothetical protein